jgi:hypothetical protein
MNPSLVSHRQESVAMTHLLGRQRSIVVLAFVGLEFSGFIILWQDERRDRQSRNNFDLS